MTDENNRIDGYIATAMCDVVREFEALKRALDYLESSVEKGMLDSIHHNAGFVKRRARKLVDRLQAIQFAVEQQREEDAESAAKLKVVK